MQGVKNIADSPLGMYRDGGIIDYHFDVTINHNINDNAISKPALTLYPHFDSTPKAGWFDKSLNRSVQPKNYDNVVMLVPSKEFIATLPYQKIPDRKDFEQLDANTRITYWQTVLKQTEQLAHAFDDFLNKKSDAHIKPFVFI
jgi:hypothetical protein